MKKGRPEDHESNEYQDEGKTTRYDSEEGPADSKQSTSSDEHHESAYELPSIEDFNIKNVIILKDAKNVLGHNDRVSAGCA